MTDHGTTQAQDAANQGETGTTASPVTTPNPQGTQTNDSQGNQSASTTTGPTGWDGKPIRPEEHVKVVDERKRYKNQASVLSNENNELKQRLEALEREKMTDTEKLQTDFESYKTQATTLAEENRKLRHQNMAIVAGAVDHEFIAWKLGQALDGNKDADPSNVLKDLKASHPALFKSNGNGTEAQTGTTDQGQSGTTQANQGSVVASPQGGAGATVEGSRGQRTLVQVEAELKALGDAGRLKRSQLKKRMDLLQEKHRIESGVNTG